MSNTAIESSLFITSSRDRRTISNVNVKSSTYLLTYPIAYRIAISAPITHIEVYSDKGTTTKLDSRWRADNCEDYTEVNIWGEHTYDYD